MREAGAAALLALRTKDANDRADAQRRLGGLGDRAYLQQLGLSRSSMHHERGEFNLR